MTPRPPQARRTRLLLGISIFWLALSMLSDGLNSLVLPKHLLDLGTPAGAATTLGLLTFVGLAGGMLVQPIAGQWSDRLRCRVGRHVFVGAGVVLLVVSLGAFALTRTLAGLFTAYLAVQVAASMAQAAQQGYIPDLIPRHSRGWRSQGMDRGANVLLLGVLAGAVLPLPLSP